MDRTHAVLTRKAHVFGLLEAICEELDLTEAQYQLAIGRYETVGRWLAGSLVEALRTSIIYPHGSIRIKTSTRPIGRQEFDVDLICRLLDISPATPPSVVKKLIGDRFRENAFYRPPVLEEKRRCWRVKYANEFYLYVTPAIMNPRCAQGGELVPAG